MKLSERYIKWVEQYATKVCPPGCMPTPGQEREIQLFVEVVGALIKVELEKEDEDSGTRRNN